jgi:hypothetical protein
MNFIKKCPINKIYNFLAKFEKKLNLKEYMKLSDKTTITFDN